MRSLFGAAVLLLGAALPGQAQNFTGTATRIFEETGSTPYYYYGVTMNDPDSGAPVLGGEGYMLCIQSGARGPGETETVNYLVLSDGASIFEDGSRTVDVVNWLVDTYYADAFVKPTGTADLRFDFERAMWDLRNHTIDELLASTTMGPSSINFSLYGDVPTNYRSSQFLVNFADDVRGDEYQDMLLITPVPEPSAAALGLIATTLLVVRRRR
ncbi:MAG: hypothetical protein QM755_24835 [Luteolibacter sp.]